MEVHDVRPLQNIRILHNYRFALLDVFLFLLKIVHVALNFLLQVHTKNSIALQSLGNVNL